MTVGLATLTFPRMAISTRLVFDCSWDLYQSIRADLEGIPLIDPCENPSDHTWRPHNQANGADYIADFSMACKRALASPHDASRLILCKLYFLEVLPYEQTRQFMGIREDVWAVWTDEIRDRCGKALLHKNMWPPRTYFEQGGASNRKSETERVRR